MTHSPVTQRRSAFSGPLIKSGQFEVAQVSNRFPTCCVADFQSADRPNLRAREMVRTACRLEALRYSRLETCASVPGRCLVYRDERFPTGACDANRSRTARSK